MDKLNGMTVYRVRVEKRPALCAVCPYFEEKIEPRIKWEPLKGST